MKWTTEQRARLFGAYKYLETEAKAADGVCELPPGTKVDLSGESITITFPPGFVIERQFGDNGDGMCEKTATQNLYGWSILAALIYTAERYLKPFNQNKRFRNLFQSFITRIVRRAIKMGSTSGEAFATAYPQVAKTVDEVKASINLPKRPEPTPRKANKPKAGRQNMPATFVFHDKKAA